MGLHFRYETGMLLRRFLIAASIAGAVAMSQAGTTTQPDTVSLSDVRARVDAALKSPHPRLMPFPGGDQAFRERLAADPDLKSYFNAVKAFADKTLTEPLPEHIMEGMRLLHVSRNTLDRMFALGFAWRVTGEKKYADRAQAEGLAVCRFSDWNPSHFLDTAEMSLAVAICLDWFDAALSPDACKQLVAGLLKNGLITSETDAGWWVKASNNWGQVCHGGLTAGALAIMEQDPELAARIIHRAIVNVPISMKAFDPDGGYPEGPGYWHYGTIYNVVLIDCLEGALGTDFGLSGLPGFNKTGLYIQVTAGPAFDRFNYADGGPGKRISALAYWFARRYGTPLDPALPATFSTIWKEAAAGQLKKSPVHQDRFVMEFLYAPLKPAQVSGPLPPLDWQDRGAVPIAVHRSRWNDPNALYAGIKAGSPAHNHGQMDGGSFVLDAQGVRWAIDLGAEDYHRIESRGMNLWDMAQDSDRWRIFRLATQSHNTLMINGKPQIAQGKALITEFSDDPAGPHTTVDLTPLYADQAAKVTRTLSMPERKRVLIHDRLTGLKPGSRVRWGMVTRAAVTLEGSKAVLRDAGKSLRVEGRGSIPIRWTVVDTATPAAEFDSPNPGTAMLAFEVTAPESGELEFTVSFDY